MRCFRGFILSCLLCLSFSPQAADAPKSAVPTKTSQPIYIYRLQPLIENDWLTLNAQTRIHLPKTVTEALLHEIPLTFTIQIQLLTDKDFLGFSTSDALFDLNYQTVLSYASFNQKFILLNQRNKKVKLLNDLAKALETLGTFEHFKILPLHQLNPDRHYQLRLRIYLDRWQLPTPLTLEALYKGDWSLDSGWVSEEVSFEQ